MKNTLVELRDIEDAAHRLDGVIRATPAAISQPLSTVVGREVVVKPEHLQRGGSFKIRGAFNFLVQHREQCARGVVAASAGNHAQGVALGAALVGATATIFMPTSAPLPKIEATRGYGAEIVLQGDSVDDCIASARKFAKERDALFVPPFDDPLVIAGQGTIGLELVAEAPQCSCIVVPVGGGGLISGVAAAISARNSKTRVIGVEPVHAASMAAARAAGHPVSLDHTSTMADGVAVRSVSELTLAHVSEFVDELVTVEEEEISRAVLALLERTKWLVEPAGALGVAALMADKVRAPGPVGIVLSGGNIDPLLLTRLIEHGLSAAGRFVMLRVVLRDSPGALAALSGAIARLGLNVVSADHHRSGLTVGLDEVEVFLTVETRDPTHRERIIPSLREQGFRVDVLT